MAPLARTPMARTPAYASTAGPGLIAAKTSTTALPLPASMEPRASMAWAHSTVAVLPGKLVFFATWTTPALRILATPTLFVTQAPSTVRTHVPAPLVTRAWTVRRTSMSVTKDPRASTMASA